MISRMLKQLHLISIPEHLWKSYPKLRSFDRLSADAMTMERRISKHAINNIA